MPTVTVPALNARVGYDDRGTGPAPPLVLLHAFPLSREMWAAQLAALSDGRRVLAPDLPGFGESEPLLAGFTMDAAADAVAGFVDAVGVAGPVAVGGLSMGGYVAMAFARRHPGRVAALVLADTKAEPDDEAARANRDKMVKHAEAHGSAGVVEQMVPKLLADESRLNRPEAEAAVRRIGTAQLAGAIVAAVKGLRDRPDAAPGLGEVRVPTLVVVGEKDAVTPPAAAQAIADRVAGSRLVVIPGVGHLSNLEAPDAFNDAVRSFLDSLPK